MRRFLSFAAACAIVSGSAIFPSHAMAAGAPQLAERVARALEARDGAALARLFPADRKVRVSLDRIADIKGYVGPGPLVEALRRYLSSKAEIRFDADTGGGKEGGAGSIRVRGTLITRDGSGQRERVGMVFCFEQIEGDWRAVEVRETG